jgi:hypothetical protein
MKIPESYEKERTKRSIYQNTNLEMDLTINDKKSDNNYQATVEHDYTSDDCMQARKIAHEASKKDNVLPLPENGWRKVLDDEEFDIVDPEEDDIPEEQR